MSRLSEPVYVLDGFWKDEKRTQCALHLLCAITIGIAAALDFIKIRFDFWTAFCVSAKFGSYAARNMFP